MYGNSIVLNNICVEFSENIFIDLSWTQKATGCVSVVTVDVVYIYT